MTDPRAFLSFLRLTTYQNLNQKQTGNTGGDSRVLPPLSVSPKRSFNRPECITSRKPLFLRGKKAGTLWIMPTTFSLANMLSYGTADHIRENAATNPDKEAHGGEDFPVLCQRRRSSGAWRVSPSSYAGIEVWMDKIDLLPGQRWQQKIPRAIRNSDFILIFFSKHSVAKRGYYYNETLPSVAETRSRKIADLRSNTAIQSNFYASVIPCKKVN
jgi:hypothetical protein